MIEETRLRKICPQCQSLYSKIITIQLPKTVVDIDFDAIDISNHKIRKKSMIIC